MQKYEIGGTPIYSWCGDIHTDEVAFEQAENAALHPKVSHVALMPDFHRGYGVPIGSVVACEDAVIPNAVGVDIGCGMCAMQTNVPVEGITTQVIERALAAVRRNVPVGFNRQEKPQGWGGFEDAPADPVVQRELDAAQYQLGTLGGGNHFMEIQAGDDGLVWLMLHSGSRNIGYKIAKHYHELAVKLCKQWSVTLDADLSFLPIGSREAAAYIKAMNFAQDFAHANRALMMFHFYEAFSEAVWAYDRECLSEVKQEINIHHNFAAHETHMGKDYWVHRKGATRATAGVLGIIPGSMGTSSYIVEGRGERLSLESCSHGAGRVMGRMAFRRETELADANESIEHVVFDGWTLDRKGKPDYSEAPMAYKDIDEVINAQRDLIDVRVKLRPLGVMKG